MEPPIKEHLLGNYTKLQLAENISLDLRKAKAKDFYWLLNTKINNTLPSGPQKWSNDLNLNQSEWEHIFKSFNRQCKENKIKEFNYKFIHRIKLPRKNYVVLESNKIVIAYTVEMRILLNILLYSANFPRLSSVGS